MSPTLECFCQPGSLVFDWVIIVCFESKGIRCLFWTFASVQLAVRWHAACMMCIESHCVSGQMVMSQYCVVQRFDKVPGNIYPYYKLVKDSGFHVCIQQLSALPPRASMISRWLSWCQDSLLLHTSRYVVLVPFNDWQVGHRSYVHCTLCTSVLWCMQAGHVSYTACGPVLASTILHMATVAWPYGLLPPGTPPLYLWTFLAPSLTADLHWKFGNCAFKLIQTGLSFAPWQPKLKTSLSHIDSHEKLMLWDAKCYSYLWYHVHSCQHMQIFSICHWV